MAKRAPIMTDTKLQEPLPRPVEARRTLRSKSPRRPDQVGKRLIGALFPEPVYRQFKVIAGEKGLQTQELMAEMLNKLFKENEKSPIA